MNDQAPVVIDNPWSLLRQYTDARIALGRAGISLPTRAQLDFQLAHAQARDAVHRSLDVPELSRGLQAVLPVTAAPIRCLHSAAPDRDVYLQRPDLGRRLDPSSREQLSRLAGASGPRVEHRPHDLALVVADGLSAQAIALNAAPFLEQLLPHLESGGWTMAPLCIVEQGRVAIGDEVAELLGAKLVVVLIGERPGLSAPDSMGLYLSWMPRVGMTDAERNCISNVRTAGLGHADAARTLYQLLSQALRRQLSGIGLKDE